MLICNKPDVNTKVYIHFEVQAPIAFGWVDGRISGKYEYLVVAIFASYSLAANIDVYRVAQIVCNKHNCLSEIFKLTMNSKYRSLIYPSFSVLLHKDIATKLV